MSKKLNHKLSFLRPNVAEASAEAHRQESIFNWFVDSASSAE